MSRGQRLLTSGTDQMTERKLMAHMPLIDTKHPEQDRSQRDAVKMEHAPMICDDDEAVPVASGC